MVDSTRSFDPHALRVRHFINLKNGIEAVPTLHAMNVHDYAFCRVQSTTVSYTHLTLPTIYSV